MQYKIYKITNTTNGKSYIGLTKQSVNRRWCQHKSQCRTGKLNKFYNALRKYGDKNFSVDILYYCEDSDSAKTAEIQLIEQHNTFTSGYNSTYGGETNCHFMGESHPMYGKHHRPESIEKISKHHKDVSGTNNPMYGRRGTDSPLYGRKRPSHSKNISGSNHPRAKTFTFTSPSGTEHVVVGGFKKFVKDHSLPQTLMYNLAKCGGSISSGKHRGWSVMPQL